MDSRSILAATAVILTIIILAPVISGYRSKQCGECHTAQNSSGDYIFVAPAIFLTAPARVSPDTEFSVFIDIKHYGDYEIRDVKAILELDPSDTISINEENEKQITSIGKMGGTKSLEWSLTANDKDGTVDMEITVEYNAYFDHSASDSYDTHIYETVLSRTIEVKPTPITPSSWNVIVEKGKRTTVDLIINIAEYIEDLAIKPSLNIANWVEITSTDAGWDNENGFSSVNAGQDKRVRMTFSIPENASVETAYIEVSWKLAGSKDKFNIPITITAPPPEKIASRSWLGLAGRVTGILSTLLLAIAIIIGGIGKAQKKIFNRIFGTAKRRAKIHCALSYEILALSIFHGVLLWAGPYRNTIWEPLVILGTLSALAMGIVSLNGILQKPIIKLLGYNIWRSIHLYLSLTALALCLIHGFTIGTDIGLL